MEENAIAGLPDMRLCLHSRLRRIAHINCHASNIGRLTLGLWGKLYKTS